MRKFELPRTIRFWVTAILNWHVGPKNRSFGRTISCNFVLIRHFNKLICTIKRYFCEYNWQKKSVLPCNRITSIFCFKEIELFNFLILHKKINKNPKILQYVPKKELILINYYLFRVWVVQRFVTEDVKAKKGY